MSLASDMAILCVTAHRPSPATTRQCADNWRARLLAKPEIGDDVAVASAIRVRQVLQEACSPANHLEQAATGGVILDVVLEVLRQFRDAGREQRDLDFW